MPNPWSGSPETRLCGSAFQELVVIPTLAPHLAREQVNAASGAAEPAPIEREESESVEIVDAPAPGTPLAQVSNCSASVTKDHVRLFFVLVTIAWVERQRVSSGRGTVKENKRSETHNAPEQVAILDLSRAEFIKTALSAHQYEDRYVVGPASGPPVRLYWTNAPGGKSGAPTISTDADWEMAQKRLAASRTSVNTVNVLFDLDAMQAYKSRKRPLSPDTHDGYSELLVGTRVPAADNYSKENQAVADAIENIRGAWPCYDHGGTCYLDGRGGHVSLNRFRLSQWGAWIAANPGASALEPPSKLLREWCGAEAVPAAPTMPKPRGRMGPHPSALIQPPIDTNTLLLTMMAPMASMAMQQMSKWQNPEDSPQLSLSRRGRISTPSTPTRRPLALSTQNTPTRQRVMSPSLPCEAASSPPPSVEDELQCCLQEFGQAKHLAPDVVAAAIAGLSAAGFSPDTIDCPSVTRLQELTGLSEGRAHQLQRHAMAWSGKVEAKRARRG